jgi:hypothetical protein
MFQAVTGLACYVAFHTCNVETLGRESSILSPITHASLACPGDELNEACNRKENPADA